MSQYLEVSAAGGEGKQEKRDCALYKIDKENVDFIFSIAQYNSIEQGLYFTSQITGGAIQHSVVKNEIINAFLFNSHKDSWVFNTEIIKEQQYSYDNENSDTLFLCIGYPKNEIYTTTGKITFNVDFQIICTTTVFIKYGNKQYIPGMKNFIEESVGSSSSGGGGVGNNDNDLMNKLTEKMTSLDTFKLLFYLNCVDISRISSLQKTISGQLKAETIKQFIKFLIVKIDLHKTDINLNSTFLEMLNKKKIITNSSSSENTPISDLLIHLDLFDETIYNSPDVYSNAGRNFTKIFELRREHQKLKLLIDQIIKNYEKQTIDFANHIKTIQDKNYFSSIIVDMQNYVLDKTARPKNIIIINVKTRVADQKDKHGVRNPMNLRYDVYTDRNRKLLKIDAVDSAFSMYDGQNIKEISSLMNDMTDGEIKKDSGKMTFDRKTKVICGPFDDIVSPNENNKSMSENVPVFKEIKNNLKTKKHVCVYGKGISGSGKTSMMIYNLYGNGLNGKIGALFHLCNNLHNDPEFKCNKITMMRSELCINQDVCDDDNAEYVFEWKESGGSVGPGFYCISPENFKTKHFNDKTKSDCPSSMCNIKNKPLHEVAELLLTKTRKVATTPLNPSSSRSHSALTMKMECSPDNQANFDCFFTIVDAAGKEKTIECNYAILLRLGNAFADDENNKTVTDDLKKNRSYHNEPEPSKGLAAGGRGGGATVEPKKDNIIKRQRENIRDFTQIDKLTDLVKGSDIDTIKNALTVLSGCKISFSEENIISDDKLKELLKADRKKYLDEINPTQNPDKKKLPSIVSEIIIELSEIKKAETKSLWKKYSNKFVLPFDKDKNMQFLKGAKDFGSKCTTKFFLLDKSSETNTSCKFIIEEVKQRSNSNPNKNEVFVRIIPEGFSTPGTNNVVDGFYIVDIVDKKEKITENKVFDSKIRDENKYIKEETYLYKPNIKAPDWLKKYGIEPSDTASDTNYTEFYKKYDEFIITFSGEFNLWKEGTKKSIEIFITQNHKIELGPISDYRDGLTPAVQKLMKDKYSSEPLKTQFYNDVLSVSTKLDQFFEVTNFIKSYCDERSNESRFINRELDDSDNVVNAICVRQNEGRPTMPLYGILKNNEYYKFTHVHNILNGATFEGQIEEYIKKSKIIESIFEMTCKLAKTTDVQNKKQKYMEVARAISFFFFTVINLSPDTEMPDRVQYYHTLKLRMLLKKIKYDSEFKSFIEAKPEYIQEFNTVTGEISAHYSSKSQKLSSVAEISMLKSNIVSAMTKLTDAENYEQAIYHINSIVSETNSINRSTIIGSIANDGDTCILQSDAGIDLSEISWTNMKPDDITE